jgi:hypothetical protein
MKSWTLFILMFASAAMAAEPTTRPDLAAPATRPFGGESRYESGRSLRRFERRNELQRPSEARSSATNQPAIYEEVGARNIFVKGNQRPPPADAAPAANYTQTASQLVLTGVSVADNGKLAFLEDQQASTVARVRLGDAIAAGKIVNITLDSLDYQDARGKVVRVYVGYNLAGGDVWGVASSGGTAPASTQPARTGPRAPGESMEDYLRRRRAAEMGR